MSYVKINLKTYIVAFLLVAGNTYQTKAQSTTDTQLQDSVQANFSPSEVLLSQTLETISIVKDGITMHLPKITKEIVPLDWATEYFNVPNFEEEEIAQREERLELRTLSQKLGMNVSNPKHLALYREAASWIGTRYKWAGNTKKGTDCSGLTGKILKDVYDKEVDRSSHIIADNLKEELHAENLEPGDLVFFTTLRKKRISHVGVYLGEGNFIHASRKGVVVSNLDETYYAKRLQKAGRI